MNPTPTDPREEKRILSPTWLMANVAPDDLEIQSNSENSIGYGWFKSHFAGKVVPTHLHEWNRYRTARTDLPPEAFAESTNSKLAAEVERLKTACEKEFQSVEQLSGENIKLAAEIAELREEKATTARCLADAVNRSATLRAELEVTRKERDEAKAQFQKARELKENYFWELGQIEMSIDGEGKIEGTGWSVAHKKVLELISIRDEANAFTKHVGGPTFKDSVDVLLRTKSQDEDKIAEMFDIIKRTGAERDTAIAAKNAAEKLLGRMASVFNDGVVAVAFRGKPGRFDGATQLLAEVRALSPAPTQEPPGIREQ